MGSIERREKLISILNNGGTAITGKALAQQLGVSRQVVVQYITLLRAEGHNILSTTNGYVLAEGKITRVFKVVHTDEETEDELKLIVDYGGAVEDVFVYHKVYGIIKGDLSLHSRKEVEDYMQSLKSGKSSYLKNVTSNYHYHTVSASSEAILDIIQEKLQERGFLAQLQDYEPVDFWKKEE